MEREKAISLLADLLATECKTVHAENSGRGIGKTLVKREQKLISKVFEAMTGEKPTADEIEEIIPG